MASGKKVKSPILKKTRITTAKSRALAKYRKERSRIASFVRRAEKRGYRFDKGIIPPEVKGIKLLPTNTIKARARRLEKLTPEKLYKKATAISEISGKQISGTERRKEERKISAIKAAQKRKAKQRQKQIEKERQEPDKLPTRKTEETEDLIPEVDTTWEHEQRIKDEENRRRMKEQEEYASHFREGEITYQTIISMINDALSSGYKYAAFDLMSELNEQIATYGKEAVMVSIGQAPQDLIEDATIALKYNPGCNQHNSAILALRQLITGEIPSAQELAEMQDRMDMDAYTDETE